MMHAAARAGLVALALLVFGSATAVQGLSYRVCSFTRQAVPECCCVKPVKAPGPAASAPCCCEVRTHRILPVTDSGAAMTVAVPPSVTRIARVALEPGPDGGRRLRPAVRLRGPPAPLHVLLQRQLL